MARLFADTELHPVSHPSGCPCRYSCNGQFMKQTPFSLQVLPSLLGAPKSAENSEKRDMHLITNAKNLKVVLCALCVLCG
jgi:hypothetical protein